jgi:hypothetical protein
VPFNSCERVHRRQRQTALPLLFPVVYPPRGCISGCWGEPYQLSRGAT